MTRRPALLPMLLLYMTLDLSLAAMPGVFVFEPSGCVESVQSNRARTDADHLVGPDAVRRADVLSPPLRPVASERLRVPRPVERLRHPVVHWLHRLPGGPPPLSEDPH